MGLNTLSTRVGNTVATPFRVGGEGINALANIPRQGMSAFKNIAEVQKQTWDALVHNFLNFSKVETKGYKKLFAIGSNLVSACTRRPAMIMASDITSTFNQWVWQPFKKLLYTPGKMFSWMRNATRILSKKEGFDFQTYDTHEVPDIWINKNKNKWFFGGVSWSSKETTKKPSKATVKESPKESSKESSKEKPQEKPKENITSASWSSVGEKKTDTGNPSWSEKPANDDTKKEKTETPKTKESIEKEKNTPEWKMLSPEHKEYSKKEYNILLKDMPTREWILAYGQQTNKWNTVEEIIANVKKDNPTFAGYLQEIATQSDQKMAA